MPMSTDEGIAALGAALAATGEGLRGPAGCLIRISLGADLPRVLQYGSSRGGWPAKRTILHASDGTELFAGDHAELLIATPAAALAADARKPAGALASKLARYAEPFATFYDARGARLLLQESFYAEDDCAGHWTTAQGACWRELFLGIRRLRRDDDGRWQALPFEPSGRPRWQSPARLYFALTNRCNRACELCSCHSDPGRGSFLPLADFQRLVDTAGPRVEVQLEGGEPTLHPHFHEMTHWLAGHPRVSRVVLCTNAVSLPWAGGRRALTAWLSVFAGKDFTLKPSANSHLLRTSPNHLDRLALLHDAFHDVPWQGDAVFKVNLRRIPPPHGDGETWLVHELEARGLYAACADFHYQAYGRGEGVAGLEKPFVVANPVDFRLIDPRGRDFGTDLEARARAMAALP